MNGVDPLVRVDLSIKKAEKYTPPPGVVNHDYNFYPVTRIGVYKVGTDPNKVNGATPVKKKS